MAEGALAGSHGEAQEYRPDVTRFGSLRKPDRLQVKSVGTSSCESSDPVCNYPNLATSLTDLIWFGGNGDVFAVSLTMNGRSKQEQRQSLGLRPTLLRGFLFSRAHPGARRSLPRQLERYVREPAQAVTPRPGQRR